MSNSTKPNTPIRNIVLVHCARADASGWQGVYGILVRNGYHVSMVQERATSFQEDVTRMKQSWLFKTALGSSRP